MQFSGTSSRVIATSIGLCGFAVAIIAGLAAENPGPVVLGRALVSLLVCYLFGCLLGMSAESVMRRRIERYKRENSSSDAVAEKGDHERHSAATA